MKGIVIWGWSRCRSVMGMVRELSGMVPVRLALWREGEGADRERQGHSPDEFADVPGVFVGDDWSKARPLFETTAGWAHLVGPYQTSPLARKVAVMAKARGDVVGVICEAPWNAQAGLKKALWEIYLRTSIRRRVLSVTRLADFFACYSGDDFQGTARVVGWTPDKIFPYGYFSPPIVGSRRVARLPIDGRRIRILATATAGRPRRGEDVVRRAMARLDPKRYELALPDFIGLDEIIALYETCDLFVAAGDSEPWGMRVNDALNCGMPFVVSDGMGARALAEKTGAGLVFRHGDDRDLAHRIEEVVGAYPRFARAAYDAADLVSPAAGARRMLEIVGHFQTS